MDILLKYVNQMKEPPKELINELEIQAMTINNKIDYIKKVLKIAEKTENSAQLKYLFKVIEIELP